MIDSITAGWCVVKDVNPAAIDQSTWPAHLRDDAPFARCGRCGRKTWSTEEFGRECRMPQPDGFPCGGRFGGAS